MISAFKVINELPLHARHEKLNVEGEELAINLKAKNKMRKRNEQVGMQLFSHLFVHPLFLVVLR